MPKTTKKTTKKRFKIKDLPAAKGDLTGKELKRVKGGADHRDRSGVVKSSIYSYDPNDVNAVKK